ncbi:MAG: TetR family transcriptional regulator [Alphaproteobacteria bacterium]|nr:TetR family transcriptional regulator [Alphaproteobacteria bacterium]
MASKRQKQTISSNPRTDVVDAALALAAKRDWANVTMGDIAEEAGISLSALSQMFDGREDILAAYARRVDADVLESYGQGGGGSHRDCLFDILMERFDRLNRDREAVVSILGSFCADPKQMVIALPHLGRSMAWMLEACGIETTGWRGAARVLGLSVIYLAAMRQWKDDESPDMAKTMASLDRSLARTERWAETFGI